MHITGGISEIYANTLNKYLNRYLEVVVKVIFFIEERIEYANSRGYSKIDSEMPDYNNILYYLNSMKIRFEEERSEIKNYRVLLLIPNDVVDIESNYYDFLLSDFLKGYNDSLKELSTYLIEERNGVIGLGIKDEDDKERLMLLEKDISNTKEDLDNFERISKKLNGMLILTRESLKHKAPEGYSNDAAWISKIIFALRSKSQAMNLNQIIDTLVTFEPTIINDKTTRRNISKKMSSIIKQALDTKLNRSESIPHTYTLIEWHNSKGELLKEYTTNDS